VVALFYEPTRTGAPPGLRAVEVVEASGKVVLHRDLTFGVARHATGGGVETWSRNDGTTPLTYRHEVIRYLDSAWRMKQSEDVDATAVPVENSPGC
jgi:hypothetical protein